MLKKSAQMFVEDAIRIQYLHLLPSRWSNLAVRLCRSTQKLKKASIATYSAAEAEFDEMLTLANTLLDEENKILRQGANIVKSELSESSEVKSAELASDKAKEEFHLLLSRLLSQLVLKESICATWKQNKDTLSDDTMRVYSHALIASFALVTISEIDRLTCILADA